MRGLACILLISALSTAPAAGQSLAEPEPWRIREVSFPATERQLPGLDVSGGRLGFGMFGLKPQAPKEQAVTVRDVTAPRQRRAGVGFSFKF